MNAVVEPDSHPTNGGLAEGVTLSDKAISNMSSEEVKKWKSAITNELTAIASAIRRVRKDEKVANIVRHKMILQSKYYPDLRQTKEKARFVLAGCSQKEGRDYWITYSPVVKYNSFKVLLAIAAKEGWMLLQMDVPTAYLKAELDERVYMRIPSYWRQYMGDSYTPGEVVQVTHAIYGLKQSGRQWYLLLDTDLKDMGFQSLMCEPCLYANETKSVFVMIYVDDLFVTGRREEDVRRMEDALNKIYKTKKIGKPHKALGMDIKYEGRRPILHYSSGIDKILKQYHDRSRAGGIPMEPGYTKANRETLGKDADTSKYRSLVGALMFPACNARPDIMFATSFLSRYCHKQKLADQRAAARVVSYLEDSKKLGVDLLGDPNDFDVVAVGDSSHGDDTEKGKSTVGFVIFIGGALVVWSSKRSKLICTSTLEAELDAVFKCLIDAEWVCDMIEEITGRKVKLTIKTDNEPLLKALQNRKAIKRTRQYRVKYHYVLEKLEQKRFTLEFVPSEENPADVQTKGLNRCKFEKAKELMRMTVA
tara:strand:- start:484 stop:2088 length:1605 start_codon:yes stop_codon:yes gene_type:complete